MRINNTWQERQKLIQARRAELQRQERKRQEAKRQRALDRANRIRRRGVA